MERASLTVDKATSANLQAAKPAMCAAAGRMLTVSQQVAYLLAYWQQTHPTGQAQAQAGAEARAAAAGGARG